MLAKTVRDKIALFGETRYKGLMFFSREKSGLNEESVLSVLREVQDPDLHKDIVSLGFIKEIKIKSREVAFKLELTTPACPVKDQLKAQCIERVKSLPGVEDVKVEMTANVRPLGAQKGGRIVLPSVRHVVAVASGKGGVGKSTVALNLALALSRAGARVGLLDADIYGPSIPLMMAVKDKPAATEDKLMPIIKHGIKVMSMGFLVPEDKAVVWRGPMVHGALTQFLTQVMWGDLDYLLIDMPPGTGDAQLTISQSAPLSGAIIVTTPQDVSLLDARRGLMMFRDVKVPVLGVIENMAGFICPHCEKSTSIFRSGGGERIANEMKVSLLGSIPIDPRVAIGGDQGIPTVLGEPESVVARAFQKIAGEMAASISILQAEAQGSFRPLSLEWK